MQILDLRKTLKPLYSPRLGTVQVLDVPSFQFLRIDGAIEKGKAPGVSPSFLEGVQALYSLAYTLKFMFKKRPADPVDYPVMALEGLWWVEDGRFDINIKDNWFFTLMILTPDLVRQTHFEQALSEVRRKKGDTPALARVRLEAFHEGLCVQALHIGPYAQEPATVARMDAFAAEKGFTKTGQHHEIYLGDPLRADPAKLRTILRHPIRKA